MMSWFIWEILHLNNIIMKRSYDSENEKTS